MSIFFNTLIVVVVVDDLVITVIDYSFPGTYKNNEIKQNFLCKKKKN